MTGIVENSGLRFHTTPSDRLADADLAVIGRRDPLAAAIERACAEVIAGQMGRRFCDIFPGDRVPTLVGSRALGISREGSDWDVMAPISVLEGAGPRLLGFRPSPARRRWAWKASVVVTARTWSTDVDVEATLMFVPLAEYDVVRYRYGCAAARHTPDELRALRAAVGPALMYYSIGIPLAADVFADTTANFTPGHQD